MDHWYCGSPCSPTQLPFAKLFCFSINTIAFGWSVIALFTPYIRLDLKTQYCNQAQSYLLQFLFRRVALNSILFFSRHQHSSAYVLSRYKRFTFLLYGWTVILLASYFGLVFCFSYNLLCCLSLRKKYGQSIKTAVVSVFFIYVYP